MADQPMLDRRRVLELSGVGSTLAVAGCVSQLSGSDPLNGDRGELAADERRVTMAVQVDQQALEQRQREIQQQFQTGNITRDEARTQLEEQQAQLVDEAFQTAVEEFDSLDLTIEDTLDRGLMLVAGRATDLIDTTNTDVIQALTDEELFEQAAQQQAARQQAAQQQSAQQEQPTTQNSSTDS